MYFLDFVGLLLVLHYSVPYFPLLVLFNNFNFSSIFSLPFCDIELLPS
ncbi:hypothetical protein EVA_17261 [gut metagenome]|uniref:Uncharacterized protein n=1 Tax=gut metagenome TaxID=749906 RepID=J9FYL4_9ZZZZ